MRMCHLTLARVWPWSCVQELATAADTHKADHAQAAFEVLELQKELETARADADDARQQLQRALDRESEVQEDARKLKSSLTESRTALTRQENEMAFLQKQARLAEDVAMHDLETLQTVDTLRQRMAALERSEESLKRQLQQADTSLRQALKERRLANAEVEVSVAATPCAMVWCV